MTSFICPVCKKELYNSGNSLKCTEGHCFDISRKGTVNLLRSNRSGHGDNKLMVDARKSFLDKGYYEQLLSAVKKYVHKYASDGCTILDCGCGECWYTSKIYEHLVSGGKNVHIIGIDVSKEAINAGASRNRAIELAVASVYDIPLKDNSCDIVISLFAPFSGNEYLRVLKENGVYITAFPLEDHLFELKQAVYEMPYKNEVADMNIDGFELLDSSDVVFELDMNNNEDIISLFSMTPYCYKTSVQDRKKLDSIDHLKTTAAFRAAAYRKVT